MSSDRLDRKRRPSIDISDDSSDEQPPVKLRRSESLSNIGKTLTDKLKNILHWLTPESFNYIIDIFKRPFYQARTDTIDMGIENDVKNVSDDDSDEIAVIAVQNGVSGARLQTRGDRKLSTSRSSRPKNASICPLASTPVSFPVFTHSTLQDRTSRTMARRPINGVSSRHGFDLVNKDKKFLKEPYNAPVTNPKSVIDIILDDESVKENDEIEIISETATQKHSRVPSKKMKSPSKEFHSSFKRDRSNSVELLSKSTFPYSLTRKSPNTYTANEVVRLQEKAQYKKLLDKVVKRSVYRPVVPKLEPKRAAIQVDLTQDDDVPLLTRQIMGKEKTQPVTDFINKYYKPCSLISYSARNYESKQKENLSEKIKDKEEDEIQIIESADFPKFKPRKKISDCEFFSDEWINELKMTILSETEKQLQIVAETEEKVERFKKRRDARLAEEMEMREHHRLAGVVFPEDIEMEEDVLPEITPEMDAIINSAQGFGDPNEKLSSLDRLTLTRNDISTLSNLNWLNDEVINFYLALIADRSKLDNFPSVYAFNSFFYTSLKTRGESNVLRWTRRIDIFSFDILFVPLHLEMHWALLVVDNRSKTVRYYDSMGSEEDRCLRIIQNYLRAEMMDKKKIAMDPNAYSLEIPKDIPKQMNGSDCGMFTLKYAEYLSRDGELTFSQENMPYFRRRMVYELLCKQIL